jgi:NitT/TauT family transport system ATP-binding protein
MDIRVENLCKSYGGRPVLVNLSLTFARGKKHCVMAPSGYGKTTLLRILMGLERPDSGAVYGLEGCRVAPVFQEDRLCENLSVGANLRLTCRGRLAEAELERCMAALMLPGWLRRSARELSGGMKRRVAIARALLSGREVLLLDEPFKGLDKECKEQVIAYVKEKTRGQTLVWVTHDETEYQSLGGEIVRLPN